MKDKLIDWLVAEPGGILRVRGLTSLGMVGLLGYLVVDGKVTVEQFLPFAVMVIAFYFKDRSTT